MKQKSAITLLITGFLFIGTINAQDNMSVTEYLGVKGPLIFDGNKYNLAWTSHPTENYFKQEYLMPGELSASFKKMLMLEFLAVEQQQRSSCLRK